MKRTLGIDATRVPGTPVKVVRSRRRTNPPPARVIRGRGWVA